MSPKVRRTSPERTQHNGTGLSHAGNEEAGGELNGEGCGRKAPFAAESLRGCKVVRTCLKPVQFMLETEVRLLSSVHAQY